MTDSINHPSHYGGEASPYETIKVIEAWRLGFALGNAVKYISRAGKKRRDRTLEDLKKARWYLDREISQLEAAQSCANAKSSASPQQLYSRQVRLSDSGTARQEKSTGQVEGSASEKSESGCQTESPDLPGRSGLPGRPSEPTWQDEQSQPEPNPYPSKDP